MWLKAQRCFVVAVAAANCYNATVLANHPSGCLVNGALMKAQAEMTKMPKSVSLVNGHHAGFPINLQNNQSDLPPNLDEFVVALGLVVIQIAATKLLALGESNKPQVIVVC